MTKLCLVPSGEYVLGDVTIVTVDQDYIYLYGLDLGPSFKIVDVVERQEGWKIWYIKNGKREPGILKKK